MRNGHKPELVTLSRPIGFGKLRNMWNYKTPGIPDDLFLQSDKVPGPTKEEIRVLTMSKARLKEGATVVDVGCGTGGLTVEAALQVGVGGKVFALDEDEEAVRLTTSNVKKFEAQNVVEVFCGKAPEAMRGLPKADAILIGGSKNLREIIQAAPGIMKETGRIVVNAILLETASTAIEELKKAGFKELDVTQIIVAKGKDIDHGTMMLARNPITIISATKP